MFAEELMEERLYFNRNNCYFLSWISNQKADYPRISKHNVSHLADRVSISRWHLAPWGFANRRWEKLVPPCPVNWFVSDILRPKMSDVSCYFPCCCCCCCCSFITHINVNHLYVNICTSMSWVFRWRSVRKFRCVSGMIGASRDSGEKHSSNERGRKREHVYYPSTTRRSISSSG